MQSWKLVVGGGPLAQLALWLDIGANGQKKKKKTASHINEEGQDIRKNPHDAFVNLDIAIYIAVRSSDPLAD